MNKSEYQTNSAYNLKPMELTSKIDFAKVCKEIRAFKKYTQQEMANKLDISLQNYQKWEAGTATPNGQSAFRLAYMQQEMDEILIKEKKRHY